MTKTTSLTAAETRAVKKLLTKKRRFDAAKEAYDIEREAVEKLMNKGGDTTYRHEEDDFKVAISNVRPEPKVVIDDDEFVKRLKRRKGLSVESVYSPVVTWHRNQEALDALLDAGTVKDSQVPKRTIPAAAAHVSVRITAVKSK